MFDKFDTDANEIRAHLKELGFTQRRGAEVLELPERHFRIWCAGGKCPLATIYALRYLVLRLREQHALRQ